MSAPSILFVVDAGPTVGGGHVMRSLTLARALEAEGARCLFIVNPAGKAMLDAFGGEVSHVETYEITEPALVTCAADIARNYDAIVIDHYGLSADDHRRISDAPQNSPHPGEGRDEGNGGGRPTLVIDDLADRLLAADLVLDSGPARRAEDYDGLVPRRAELLLGPHYAPVRPAFAALRKEALARRAKALPVRRILVSLGLTDVGGITGRVVELMLPATGAAALDVVVGAAAPSLPRLRERAQAEPRLVLHVDTQDMPRLTLEADLAVGASGSSTWERCVLALPTLSLILADNQRPAARALAEAGAIMGLEAAALDFDATFSAALGRLIDEPVLRDALSAASAAVCDGRGAARVAERFLALIGQGKL
ncbi:UDP-2,4-diacetamido-2,4,6-trideoxy-beta-L-altropyranose hydrolase [Caulobacter sp. DWP3-1-3b2]|uniref:UDP-2,4-diacetamido-2,4, 6-trideoxy-beta-L-altropyranose hydrolase n=1 Tax=Caulobacter sp. DWP3-1-3b2 TaxID=2804643 RepID=UPI003CF91E64